MIGLDHLLRIVEDGESSDEDIIHGLLRFTLARCAHDPEGASIAQVAQVIEAAAKFRTTGGGQDDGLAKLVEALRDE